MRRCVSVTAPAVCRYTARYWPGMHTAAFFSSCVILLNSSVSNLPKGTGVSKFGCVGWYKWKDGLRLTFCFKKAENEALGGRRLMMNKDVLICVPFTPDAFLNVSVIANSFYSKQDGQRSYTKAFVVLNLQFQRCL